MVLFTRLNRFNEICFVVCGGGGSENGAIGLLMVIMLFLLLCGKSSAYSFLCLLSAFSLFSMNLSELDNLLFRIIKANAIVYFAYIIS